MARASFVTLAVTCPACTLLNPLSGLADQEVADAGLDGNAAREAGPDTTALGGVDAGNIAACPCTLFGQEFRGTSDPDPKPTELGVRFRSDVPGKVHGIRYYRGPQNLGPHVGTLWTNSGETLATAGFTNETATGWQTATFATPVPIDANTSYIASYRAPAGHYAATIDFFGTAFDAPPLHADVRAGLYTYGLGVPDQVYRDSNYWVDVVFTP